MYKIVSIIYPFDPNSGAGGRKRDAAAAFEEMHKILNIKTSNLYLNEYIFITSQEFIHSPQKNKISAPEKMKSSKYLSFRLLVSIFFAVKSYKLERPDFIIVYGLTAWPVIIGGLTSLLTGIPFALYEHRSHYRTSRMSKRKISYILKFIVKRAEFILCLTESHRKDIAYFFPEKNISVLPISWLPPIAGNNTSGPQNWLIPQKKFVISAWTNWRSIKRLDLIAESFSNFRKKHPDSMLIVAGPLESCEENNQAMLILKNEILENNAILIGPLNRADIRKLATISDVAVIASDIETFGLPAIEALCAGTPVITTICGGPEEIVEHNINGLIVEPGSAKSITNAMCYLYENFEMFDKDSIAKKSMENFSTKKHSELLQSAYLQSINLARKKSMVDFL